MNLEQQIQTEIIPLLENLKAKAREEGYWDYWQDVLVITTELETILGDVKP